MSHLLERLFGNIQVQDIIAMIFTGVVSFLWITGQEVPEGLLNVTLIILGFYFGDKNAQRASDRAIHAMSPTPPPPFIAGQDD